MNATLEGRTNGRKIALVVRGLFEMSDSIGFDCVAEYKLLTTAHGDTCEVRIFCETFRKAYYPDIPVQNVANLPQWVGGDPQATVIYHWCDGWGYFDDLFLTLPCRLIVRWHNNTPPWFFASYSAVPVANTVRGFTSLLTLAEGSRVEFWVNSVYTARQLAFLGVTPSRVHVVYPLSPLLDRDRTPRPPTTTGSARDGQPLRILFVGRAVPHKGHKHLVATAALVQRATGRPVRLTMPGRPDGFTARYVREATALARDVAVGGMFPGEVPLARLRELYASSDVFLCLSEHEGFGLPIFEAMRAGLPVVGLRSTAIGEFLGHHPLAVSRMDYVAVAAHVVAVLDPAVREAVLRWQDDEILPHYTQQVVAAQLADGLAGDHAWPPFGGESSAELEQRVAGIENQIAPRLRAEAAGMPALSRIPTDTIDRFVTRYDIDAYGSMANDVRYDVDARSFFQAITAKQVQSARRMVGPVINSVRRLALSVQAGLLAGLYRLNSETRAELTRIDRSLEEIRGDLQSVIYALRTQGVVLGTPTDPSQASPTLASYAPTDDVCGEGDALRDPRRRPVPAAEARREY